MTSASSATSGSPNVWGAVIARSALWAGGWSIGAAIGVALGAYLTATSGLGAPGVSALDRDGLLVLPLLAVGIVFAVSFVCYAVIFARLGRA